MVFPPPASAVDHKFVGANVWPNQALCGVAGQVACALRQPWIASSPAHFAMTALEFGSDHRMVPRGGIEPPTLRFSVACSTN